MSVLKVFTLVFSFAALIGGLSATDAEFECGVRQQATVKLILYGRQSEEMKWPWHVALFHSLQYACGGTLISRSHVLTAAHCVTNQDTGYLLDKSILVVDVGAHDLSQQKHRRRYSVRTIHTLDSYTHESHHHDIAIIELNSEVVFNQYVQPACLYHGPDLTGKVGTAMGWGRTEFEANSTVLREAQLPVVDFFTCRNSDRATFGYTLEKEMFCAGYTNGTGLCNGDSGGGLFFEVNGVWHLGGIISFTKAQDGNTGLCQTKGYTVFTRVYDYIHWIGEKTKLPENCGVYNHNRIYLGEKTKVAEFPWMALLIYENPKGMCVGTLIHRRYVLTSAYAVTADIPIKVRLGEHTRNQTIDCNEDGDCAPPVRDIAIESIIKHPNYYKNASNIANNIALIKLAESVAFEDHIQPVCLPTVPRLREMQPTRYIITGWGRSERNGRFSSVLLKATIPAVALEVCQNWIKSENSPFKLTDNQLCAGGKDLPDTCDGDPGAPLGYPVRFNGIRFVQFGINSFGSTVCGEREGVYTKVSSYISWIVANIEP